MPETSVKWMNDFFKNSEIDVWLPIRLISPQFNSMPNVTSFKYFAEFNCKNFEINKTEIESHSIIVENIEINSSNSSNKENLLKSKRSIQRDNKSIRERVVSKYVNYDVVTFF